MNFESIETVKKMLQLNQTDEELVNKFIAAIQDKDASEPEVEAAKEALISVLGKAFLANGLINRYVVQSELVEMKDKLSSKNDDNAINDIMSDMEYYLRECIQEDIKRAVLPALEDLQKKVGINAQDQSIKSSLQDIMEALKLKAAQNAVFRHKMDKSVSKKLGENAKKRLDSFENSVFKMIERIESIDETDINVIDDLEKDLLKLIERLAGLNRIIEAKRENEPIVYAKNNTQTTNSSTRAMQKYGELGFNIQRYTPGPIDNPTTEEKFNLPKSIKYVIAGVGLVAVIVSTVFITKSVVAKDNTPSSDPTISNNPNNNFDQIVEDVVDNWTKVGIDTTKDDVEQILKSFMNEESTYTIGQSDMVVLDSLNIVLASALNGEETTSLDLSSLVAEETVGKEAVDKMQGYLDGCIEDPENRISYITEALKVQARIFGEGETVDGISFAEDSTTDPRVKIVWARLTMGVNMFIGTIEQEINIEVNGNVYSAEDLLDNTELTDYIKDAKTEITGESEKRQALN